MMGTSSRNIIDVFVKLIQSLECPVCYEYVATPIWQCEAGHIICNNCKCSIHNCPTCRLSFSNVRVRSLEQISDLMLFPCKNDGCEKILPLSDIKYHENTCSLANAFSRPDDFTRSSILQYNILKYIEHDIAPFFITGQHSHERGTQTDFLQWSSLQKPSTNLKDASTMAESNPRSVVQPAGAFSQGILNSKNDKTSKYNVLSSAVGGAKEKPSIFGFPMPPNSTVPIKPLTAVKKTYTFSTKKTCTLGTSQDKGLTKTEQKPNAKGKDPPSMTSKKLSVFFNENDKNVIYKKGSTKYNCYLQSTSSKSGEICKNPKSGFDFSPFINESSACSTSHSTVVTDSSPESRFKFNFAKSISGNTNNTSEPDHDLTAILPQSSNESVFYFETRNEQSSEPKLSTPKVRKSKPLHSGKEPKCSGFDFSEFLKATPSLNCEDNRSKSRENTLMPSTNITTVNSWNASNTNVIQSVNTPLFSPIVFSDVTYSDNFEGNLKSLSSKAARVFNYKQDNSITPHPDTSSNFITIIDEDIESQPSTSKIPSTGVRNDFGSGMPFSISRNTDPLDSLPTNSSLTVSYTEGGNSSTTSQANPSTDDSIGSKNNEKIYFSSQLLNLSKGDSQMPSCPGTSRPMEPLPDTNSNVSQESSKPFEFKPLVWNTWVGPTSPDFAVPPQQQTSSVSDHNSFKYFNPAAQVTKSWVSQQNIFPGKSSETFPCDFKKYPSGSTTYFPLKDSGERSEASDSGPNKSYFMKSDASCETEAFLTLPSALLNPNSTNIGHGGSDIDYSTSALFKPRGSSRNQLFTFGRDNNKLWDSGSLPSTSQGNSKPDGFQYHLFIRK